MKSEKAMEEARQLLAQLYQSFGGRVVFLILPRGKKRLEDKGWDKITFEETQTPAYQKKLVAALTRGGNVAVRLGPLSDGLRAIDIDRKDRLEEFCRLNPQLCDTVRVYGLKGCQFFFRLPPNTSFPTGDNGAVLPLKCADGEDFGEWRFGESSGAYSLIFGQHPDDSKVVWRIEGNSVRELLFADIKWPHDVSLPWEKEKAAQGGPLGFIPPDLEKRIAAYLAKCPPSIAGLRGDDALFVAACKIGNGFALTEDQIYEVLKRWFNPHCRPPWDEARLRYKASEAMSVPHDKARGHLWGDDSAAGPWPDPKPIHVELLPVAPLLPEMIVEPLRGWIVDEAYRLQCPLDFVAVPVICVFGGIIGAGCMIRPKALDTWSEMANLWGEIIGRPGTKKSPAIKKAIDILHHLEELAGEDYKAHLKDYELERVVYAAQHKALLLELDKATQGKGGSDVDGVKARLAKLKAPVPPVWRRYVTNDSTIEKLHELMKENPRGIVTHRDELVGFLKGLDRYDQQEARYFHITAWNGYSRYVFDRIGRGTVEALRICETVLGAMVPSKLNGYFRQMDNLDNDGLPQRFQLGVYPDECKGELVEIVDAIADEEARSRVIAIAETLAHEDFEGWTRQNDKASRIPYFRFDENAQAFFNRWLLNLEEKLLGDDNDIVIEHLSKYRKLMPALSLIFHLVENADKVCSGQPISLQGISLRCAELAAQWCAYLETHARRIYGLAVDTAARAAKRLLEKIKIGVVQDGFQARDIYSRNWSFLDSKESVEAALDELVETGWLRAVPSPRRGGRGRPLAPSYLIHPEARG